MLFNNNFVNKEITVASLAGMPLGQFAGILGHHSQVTAVDFKVTYSMRMYNSTIIVEVGREMLGAYQFPIRPVV